MKVTEIPHGLDLGKATEGYIRAVGVHASDLYGAYFKAVQPERYDKRDKHGKELPMSWARVELGTVFETIAAIILAERLLGSRPDEMKVRAKLPSGRRKTIYFSPDHLFDDDDGTLVLGEFKCTWMSTKDAPHHKKFDKYRAQMMLYCYWLGITKARLYVFFVNGDWKTFEPDLRAWEFEFTKDDLQRNYNRIMTYAEKKGLV